MNYNNGKIYKIEPISGGEEGGVYIGSTTKNRLCERMSCHRSDYKRWKEGKSNNYLTVFMLFDKYGLENCHIGLVEAVVANSKDELTSREGYWIKQTNCVNKNIAGRTKKEGDKIYYENNKLSLLDYQSKYDDNHKEEKQQYYKNNKDKIKQYSKQYYENR